MSKPLSRRLFGKAMAAVPLAAKEAVAPNVQALANYNVVPMMPPPYGFGVLSNPLLALAKQQGMLPKWAERNVQNEMAERSRTLSPDVATMQSVSLSGKYMIQRQRMERAFENGWQDYLADSMAQRAFWKENGPGSW